MSIGNFLEMLSQGVLVAIILVGRLGVDGARSDLCRRQALGFQGMEGCVEGFGGV